MMDTEKWGGSMIPVHKILASAMGDSSILTEFQSSVIRVFVGRVSVESWDDAQFDLACG
jgi:hypothetical protein